MNLLDGPNVQSASVKRYSSIWSTRVTEHRWTHVDALGDKFVLRKYYKGISKVLAKILKQHRTINVSNATAFKSFNYDLECQCQHGRYFPVKLVQIIKRFFNRFIVLKIYLSWNQIFLVLQKKVKAKDNLRDIVFQIRIGIALIKLALVLVASVPIWKIKIANIEKTLISI